MDYPGALEGTMTHDYTQQRTLKVPDPSLNLITLEYNFTGSNTLFYLKQSKACAGPTTLMNVCGINLYNIKRMMEILSKTKYILFQYVNFLLDYLLQF